MVGLAGFAWYKLHVPKAMRDLQRKLQIYAQEISSGTLKHETIDDLMTMLKEMQGSKKYAKKKMQFSLEETITFLNLIFEYTLKLAADNHVDLLPEEIGSCRGRTDMVVDLQAFLKLQQKIFDEAA